MASITMRVHQYIAEHPSVRDCLKKGIINYSALSRKIAGDLKLEERNFDAVLVACRRFERKFKENPVEGQIREILKKSKLQIRNKMIVALIEKGVFYGHISQLHHEVRTLSAPLNIIEGSDTITLITSLEMQEKIEKIFKDRVIKITDNLAEVNLKSPKDLEQVPGVIAYLTSLLADKGINIIETMSTWTDTLFVLDEKDIGKAMEVLRF